MYMCSEGCATQCSVFWQQQCGKIYRYGAQSVIRITTDQNQKWSASQNRWYYHFAAPIRSGILAYNTTFHARQSEVVYKYHLFNGNLPQSEVTRKDHTVPEAQELKRSHCTRKEKYETVY